MQHGRATSALAARRLVGCSRTMSLLMALCLFAAVALAIPGFTAHADGTGTGTSPEDPFPIPTTSFAVNMEHGSTYEREYADTGFWGVRLDGGTLTPVAPLTFERRGDQVTAPSDLLLWQVSSLSNYSMNVQVPNGANNREGVTWEPGSTHTVEVVIYADSTTPVSSSTHYVRVYKPYSPEQPEQPEQPEPTTQPTPTPTTQPAPTPTTQPTPAPTTQPTTPAPTVEPTTAPPTTPPPPAAPTAAPSAQPSASPSAAPVPQPDDPQLPAVRPTPSPSASPAPAPSVSANPTKPSDTPVSPVTDESQLNDANKGGVSAAFTAGQLTINVPADKAAVGDWVSANIMQTGEARWLQVADSNQVSMDVTGLPNGDYKVVVANRSHELVGWAEFKVASAVGTASSDSATDASGAVKLHAETLSSSQSGDESQGLNGYLLGAGVCMLILGGLVVVQVLSGPKIGSSSRGGGVPLS